MATAASTNSVPGPPLVGRLVCSGRRRTDQPPEGGAHRGPQGVDVVAALEEDDQPSRFGGVAGHRPGQFGEVAGRQGQVGQRVVAVGVEAGRDQYPGRGEGATAGETIALEAGADDVAGGPGGKRDIDRGAPCRGSADLVAAPVPGKLGHWWVET